MKVYAVIYNDFYMTLDAAIPSIEKIFATREKADEFVEQKGGDYEVQEFIVE